MKKGEVSASSYGVRGFNDPCSEVFHHALTGLPCPFGLGAEDTLAWDLVSQNP